MTSLLSAVAACANPCTSSFT